MADAFYETLKRTALDHLHAYESPGAFNPEDTLKYRSEDCVQHLHPSESVPESFRGALYKEQYSGALRMLGAPIDKLTFDLHDLAVDTQRRTVATSFTATFDFKAFGNEPAEHGYTAEYFWIVEMDPSGQKVVRMEEFLDPARLLGHVLDKAHRYAEFTSNK